MLIIRATAWLQIFLDSPLAVTMGELVSLADQALDADLSPEDLVNDKLVDLFKMVTESDQVSEELLHTKMLSVYQMMAEDEFGRDLLAVYQIEDEQDSDPDEDASERWHIPLPGEVGNVSCRAESGNGSEESREDQKVDFEEGDLEVAPEVVMAEKALPRHDTVDSSRVTIRPPRNCTYAVVRWKDGNSEVPRYSVWAAKAYSRSDRGVKVMKSDNRLHVTMNYVSQRGGAEALKDVVIYDPDGRVSLQEVGRSRFVRDPEVTFDAWIEGKPVVGPVNSPGEAANGIRAETATEAEAAEPVLGTPNQTTDEIPDPVGSGDGHELNPELPGDNPSNPVEVEDQTERATRTGLSREEGEVTLTTGTYEADPFSPPRNPANCSVGSGSPTFHYCVEEAYYAH